MLVQSGKKATDQAWWLPGPVNEDNPELNPYVNGHYMTDNDAYNIFHSLKQSLKKYGYPPFKHDYISSVVRLTGVNLLYLLKFDLNEIAFVRYDS